MNILPKPKLFVDKGKNWSDWAKQLIEVLDKREAEKADQNKNFPSYTLATLPQAEQKGILIYVEDESGGATLAFSDGANWRRVQDRAVVS